MALATCGAILAAAVAVVFALVWRTCWAPIQDVHLHFVPQSEAGCLERAQAVRCPAENDLRGLDTAGFAVLRGAVDPDLLESIPERLGMIPRSRNMNVNGTFLQNQGPEFFSALLRARLDALVAEAVATAGSVSQGRTLELESVGFYATGRPGWPSWRQVPHHQDHESSYWCGSSSYLLVFVVADKEDASRENIDFISFDALGACNPVFREAMEGTAASISLPVQKVLAGKFRLNSWQQKIPKLYERLLQGHADTAAASAWPFSEVETLQVSATTGRWIPVDIDMEQVNCTPNLDVGDVVFMRGDVLHQTQRILEGRQTRRLALAAHFVDMDRHGLSTELLASPGPVLLRGLAKNPLYAEAFGAGLAAGMQKVPMRLRTIASISGSARARKFWTSLFHLRFRVMEWMVEQRERMIIDGWRLP